MLAMLAEYFRAEWPAAALADIFASSNIKISNVKQLLSRIELSPDRVQEILYRMVDRGYYDRLIELFTFDAPDESITADTTFTEGVIIRKNLSIASGVTLTMGTGPAVIIADTLDNAGTIKSGWIKGAGGEPPSSPGYGGGGAGGIIIFARTINIGTISADGRDGEDGGTTKIWGDGKAGGSGEFWCIDPDTPPSGGNGGYRDSGNPNGGGGGGVDIYGIGGPGGSATVTVFTNARELLIELLKAAVDWWLINILNKTPSSTKNFPYLGGSGGGGGGEDDGSGDGGGGGGGGGQIIIYGTNITAGTLTAKGGKGGNGGTEDGADSGGGGGGGGIIYVFYKSLTNTNSFDVSGGAGGTGDIEERNGTSGETGIAREIAV